MLKIINARNIKNKKVEFSFDDRNKSKTVFDAKNLIALPALIDPHVHFRTPGLEHKENWITASKAALCGGYTTVFDMPNTLPPTITEQTLKEKKQLINQQLKAAKIPLHYELFFGADKHHFSEIHKIKNDVIGIKVFMGCSTGNLVMDDDESLHALFAIASAFNLIVAVHAEDEETLKQRKAKIPAKIYSDHSNIRNIPAAVKAVEKAIFLSRLYKTRLYVLHVSSKEEIDLIKKAKREGLPVFAETTPHHLFLNTKAYQRLQGKAVVNPPLRTANHQKYLFDAINAGIIDTIGSDHAPHTIGEKSQPYPTCPSGMPGIETTLALLLNAYHEKKISFQKIVELTSQNAIKIFNLKKNNDIVLIDLNETRIVSGENLKTKCHWSAFEGVALQGWPTHVVMSGKLYTLKVI